MLVSVDAALIPRSNWLSPTAVPLPLKSKFSNLSNGLLVALSTTGLSNLIDKIVLGSTTVICFDADDVIAAIIPIVISMLNTDVILIAINAPNADANTVLKNDFIRKKIKCENYFIFNSTKVTNFLI
jgi:hypothetical protein